MVNASTQPCSCDTTPYFFLIGEGYMMGTPRGIAGSHRTIDIAFEDLAQDYDLQSKLKMASCVLIRPDVLYAEPLAGRELIEGVATYLAAFAEEPAEQEQRRQYLLNNGLVRILVTDPKLKEEILALPRKA